MYLIAIYYLKKVKHDKNNNSISTHSNIVEEPILWSLCSKRKHILNTIFLQDSSYARKNQEIPATSRYMINFSGWIQEWGYQQNKNNEMLTKTNCSLCWEEERSGEDVATICREEKIRNHCRKLAENNPATCANGHRWLPLEKRGFRQRKEK